MEGYFGIVKATFDKLCDSQLVIKVRTHDDDPVTPDTIDEFNKILLEAKPATPEHDLVRNTLIYLWNVGVLHLQRNDGALDYLSICIAPATLSRCMGLQGFIWAETTEDGWLKIEPVGERKRESAIRHLGDRSRPRPFEHPPAGRGRGRGGRPRNPDKYSREGRERMKAERERMKAERDSWRNDRRNEGRRDIYLPPRARTENREYSRRDAPRENAWTRPRNDEPKHADVPQEPRDDVWSEM